MVRAREEVKRLRSRVAHLDGALRRTAELLADSRVLARQRRQALEDQVARFRWFRRAACRQVALRLAEAEFHARVREVAHQRLQKRFATTRGKARRRALRPKLAAALGDRARFRRRRARLRELQRRCRLDAASRALRRTTSPPPPPAPRAPGR